MTALTLVDIAEERDAPSAGGGELEQLAGRVVVAGGEPSGRHSDAQTDTLGCCVRRVRDRHHPIETRVEGATQHRGRRLARVTAAPRIRMEMPADLGVVLTLALALALGSIRRPRDALAQHGAEPGAVVQGDAPHSATPVVRAAPALHALAGLVGALHEPGCEADVALHLFARVHVEQEREVIVRVGPRAKGQATGLENGHVTRPYVR